MLFEEAILFLLRRAGYKPVTETGADPTLKAHSAGNGIAVVGRGAHHQIDAIADYQLPTPFIHPQRLLVEGKCYSGKKPVGLETVRNAVGVLKDVSEFWATADGLPVGQRRYHYQKAIFSATTFTAHAERYAFAHDVYLFPMAKSSCFSGLLKSIFAIKSADVRRASRIAAGDHGQTLRRRVRRYFEGHHAEGGRVLFGGDLGPSWVRFGEEVTRLGGVVVALVGGRVPLFLVPSSREVMDTLGSEVHVRIRWTSTRGWKITDDKDAVLFSFDIPPVLFHLYADDGVLTRLAAATMKEEMLEAMQAVIFQGDRPRVVRFLPDVGWFERLKHYAAQIAEPLIRDPVPERE